MPRCRTSKKWDQCNHGCAARHRRRRRRSLPPPPPPPPLLAAAAAAALRRGQSPRNAPAPLAAPPPARGCRHTRAATAERSTWRPVQKLEEGGAGGVEGTGARAVQCWGDAGEQRGPCCVRETTSKKQHTHTGRNQPQGKTMWCWKNGRLGQTITAAGAAGAGSGGATPACHARSSHQLGVMWLLPHNGVRLVH